MSLLPWVIGVARAVRTTIVTNLLWAFGYNLSALALASCGLLRPVWAAAIMAGSSILVVMNSLRLERLHDPGELPAARTASVGKSQRAGGLSPLPGT